jgi:2-polyprenyl-3-methyl-5-hydroxy-6-metoxy-1,4-benzoquinol methylase
MSTSESSGSDYHFDDAVPHTKAYLSPSILQVCREACAGGRVIDLGCGNGHLCRDLQSAHFVVVGIDPSESGVAAARKLVPKGTFYQAGVYDDPALVPGGDFDLAVSTEVVEHLFRPRELARFARCKLKVGGRLIISTPYHGYLKNVALALCDKWDFHHTPLWDGGHIKFWSRRTLTKLLEEEGFRIIDFRGCGRLPYFWKSMLLTATKLA